MLHFSIRIRIRLLNIIENIPYLIKKVIYFIAYTIIIFITCTIFI